LLVFNCKKNQSRSDDSKQITSDGFTEITKYKQQKMVKLDKVFDYSETTVNYFDKSKVDTADFEIMEDDTPFEIVDYGPVDQLPAHMKKPTIYVVFSQAVVPLSKLGAPMISSSIMSIEPKVNGVYRWYGTKLLNFEPTEEVLPQRNYKVIINKSIKSLGGKNLDGINEFTFHSEYLNIASVLPSGDDIPLSDAKKIRLEFTYSVNLDTIKKYIKVESRNNNYSFQISRFNPEKNENQYSKEQLSKMVVLTMDKAFEENNQVMIIIEKGAKSEDDFIGIPDKIVRFFTTISPFRYLDNNTYSYSFSQSKQGDSNPIYLNFSHPIDEKSVKGNIQVSLNVPNLDDYIEVWGNIIKINNLPVQYNSSYAIIISEKISDIYGRKIGQKKDIIIDVPNASSYYYFPNKGTKILEASFNPKIIYEYQNIFDGLWKAGTIENTYYSDEIFNINKLETYDFGNVKKNMKHFEVLDLTPWLNQDKKGFVGFTWNFNPKDVPNEIRDYDYASIIMPKLSEEMKSNFDKWFYTNNTMRGFRIKSEYYNNSTKAKIRDALLEIGYDLKRSNWTSNLALQVTDLGITARVAYNKIIVFVSQMSTGEPVTGADVYLMHYGASSINDAPNVKTDKRGIATFDLKDGDYRRLIENRIPKIRAVKGSDKVEYIPDSHNVYHFGINHTNYPNQAETTTPETFIFTDRGIYKPGETLTYRGIDRDLKLGKYYVYNGNYKLSIKGQLYNSPEIYTVEETTSESGGFYGNFILPEDIQPGYYYIDYRRDNNNTRISFQIANFRRLNVQVKVKKPDRMYFSDDKLSFTIAAEYLAGGALSSANCQYYWSKSITNFRPKGVNWQPYRFGTGGYNYDYENENVVSSGNGKLDGVGKLTVTQDTTGLDTDGKTYKYTLSARVEDVDRQVIQSTQSAIVHPASFYIGAKFDTGNYFVKKKESVPISYAFVSPDGKTFDNFTKKQVLNVKLSIEEYKIAQQKGVNNRINSRYQWVKTVESEQTIKIDNSTGVFTIKPENCGQYTIEITSNDKDGRIATTSMYLYSTGSDWIPWRTENAQDINLKIDKNSYKPGEKVKVLIQSPIPQGKYLLTIEREGIFEEQVLDLIGSANVIEIPVKEEYTPVFYIALSSYSVRDKEPSKSYNEPDLGKPKGYFGITTVIVDTTLKEIALEIVPTKTSYLPGTEAELTIHASKDGAPLANTEITFLVVDRGVVDLINYHVPNPLKYFYDISKFPLKVVGGDSRSLLIDPVTYEVKDLQGGDGEDKIKTRKDFRPTAFFEPYLKTDENGEVKVKFKLPDSLTTYRCTAVAVNKDLFGITENEIQVKNLINVRTALPRKLRVRDTSFAGVILTNLDSKEHEVTVSIETDILTVEGTKEQKVMIPANSVIEVLFRLASLQEGKAIINFTMQSDVLNERLESIIVVEKPVIKEVFSTIGETKSVDSNNDVSVSQEGLLVPENISQGYGGVSLTLDSTKFTTLKASIEYLWDYPFGCMEQRSSKIFPLVVFGEKVKSFINIDPYKIVEDEFNYWGKIQNSDGGFPFWTEGGNESSIYVSIKVAGLLHFAKKNNFKIPDTINIPALLDYIALEVKKSNSEYLEAYSLYVESLYGRNVKLQIDNMIDNKQHFNNSVYALLGLAYYNIGNNGKANQILNILKNNIKVGTQSIDLVDPNNSYRYYFNSDVSELALVYMLFDSVAPKSPLIPKIVKTIMSNQKSSGYWTNTYTTAWVIQAFAQGYEKESGKSTDFHASVNIAGQEVISETFKGVSLKPFYWKSGFDNDKLGNIKRNAVLPINFKADGVGKLYYTASIKYSLASEIILSRDEGFSIFTEVYTIDGNKVDDPTKLKLGETYKMKAIISSSKNRQFVGVRIPVPSGAEVLDSSLVTTASYKDKTDSKDVSRIDWWMYRPLQFIMDNEVQYVFNYFASGQKEVEFIFRTTTPGIYPTPPAMVECMYEEEVFGRTEGKLTVIRAE